MFHWKAIYNDGTYLSQYNEDDSENKYSLIDRSKLTTFILYNNTIPVIVLHLDQNKRLIYRKRIALRVGSGIKEVVYIVGWQETKEGVNFQNILFLFEDGHIEVVDRFYKNHRWFRPIKFIPEEML